MEEKSCGLGKNKRDKVNADQECWIKDRIRDAIRMALVLERNKGPQANEHAYNMALDGIIEGQAIEIIHTLGLDPLYVNLRPEKNFINPLDKSGSLISYNP